MRFLSEYRDILRGARLLNPAGDINLHTHTCLCDGRDEPEEMVLAAVQADFRVLGFSGHGYCLHDLDCCMTEEGEDAYWRILQALKEKYRRRLDIRIGMERDFFNENHLHPFDYEIGSVHYVEVPGGFLSVDDSYEAAAEGVEKYFGGSWRKYVECYYETEGQVLERTGADLVGHLDLVTKFNRNGRCFDEGADWYRKAALSAVRRILSRPRFPRPAVRDLLGEGPLPVFEINTGGMAKGCTDRPYPAPFLLREIVDAGCPVVLSSDCHQRESLRFGFGELLG